MPGEREARGKGIHTAKNVLNLHKMDSLPLAAARLGRE
jgi:hypothetical protein